MMSNTPPSYKNNYCLYKQDVDLDKKSSRYNTLLQNSGIYSDGEDSTLNLAIEYCDMDDAQEKALRKYILYKANRNLISSNSSSSIGSPSLTTNTEIIGHIGILPGSVSGNTSSSNILAQQGTSICYFAQIEFDDLPSLVIPAIESPKPERKADSEISSNSHALSMRKQCYIVCLTCEVESDESFALFRTDLDMYASKLKNYLMDVKLHNKNPDILKDYLSSWYSYTVEYVLRCVDLLRPGNNLATFLHSGLLCRQFTVHTANPKSPSQQAFIEDITRFLKAISIGSVASPSIGTNKPTKRSSSIVIAEGAINDTDKETLVLNLDSSYKLHLNIKTSNHFCEEYSKELLQSKDPLHLRNLMEHYKFKVIQELNQLRRLIEQAKLNNYFLYKAYRMLQKTKNADILLSLLLQDILTTPGAPSSVPPSPSLRNSNSSISTSSSSSSSSTNYDPNILEVMEVIKSFLDEETREMVNNAARPLVQVVQ